MISNLDIKRAAQIPLTSILDHFKIEYDKNHFYHIRCPFPDHASDSTPSFKIYNNNSFACFGCQAGGSSIHFVMHYKKVDRETAVNFILKTFNISSESLTKNFLKFRESLNDKKDFDLMSLYTSLMTRTDFVVSIYNEYVVGLDKKYIWNEYVDYLFDELDLLYNAVKNNLATRPQIEDTFKWFSRSLWNVILRCRYQENVTDVRSLFIQEINSSSKDSILEANAPKP